LAEDATLQNPSIIDLLAEDATLEMIPSRDIDTELFPLPLEIVRWTKTKKEIKTPQLGMLAG